MAMTPSSTADASDNPAVRAISRSVLQQTKKGTCHASAALGIGVVLRTSNMCVAMAYLHDTQVCVGDAKELLTCTEWTFWHERGPASSV